ncbi:MAG: putative KAP-like P-loop ATPase [Alteromonas macleodii]|jgi:predicted KAP-like P-loop ATPase|uniref:KAP family P-loop NTPase fold protein n=1 Tax=Rheinheimera aquimaris TaxID=412437 RepID=UPI0039E55C15
MKDYFNDSPILTKNDDQYGVTLFSETLAKSFLKIKNPVGTTIALHGPWGSGKSSVVNLVKEILKQENVENLTVSEFKSWWFRGEEALALAFLQNLNSILRTAFKDKVKDLVPKMGRGLLQAGPVIGSALALTPAGPLGGLIGGAFDFTKRFFPEGDALEEIFLKLSEVLKKENRRFLIIIDDIDRLSPDEVIAIFRLVKSVGKLPNVMYLLVFDRKLAESIVQEKYPSEGPHFLEKIIQAGFELPTPLPTDLNAAVLESIFEVCGSPSEEQVVRFMNIFYDVVAQYISSPRHVSRLQNAISVTWPAIASEVNLDDFVALETLRLYEPSLFNAIRANKSILCGSRKDGDPRQNDDSRFDIFLNEIPDERHELIKTALRRIFPRMESTTYGSDWLSGWRTDRRVCIEAHFDTYFRLSLSDETLPYQKIDELVSNAENRELTQEAFRLASQSFRRNGTSMVPVYLDELTVNSNKVAKEKVMPLLSALFEIHDEIDLERDADKGFMAMATTSIRYHWLIRRLTRDRFQIDERTKIYSEALKLSSLGWLVDFTISALSDYQERDDRPMKREDECLVSENTLRELTVQALNKIRDASEDGTLLKHKDLHYILYGWRTLLDNNPSEVREWTDKLLNEPKAVLTLARAMTSESWSMGMGGFGSIGDRVSKRSVRAQISNSTDIIDTKKFRTALESAEISANLNQDEKKLIQQFLLSWDKQNQGDDE